MKTKNQYISNLIYWTAAISGMITLMLGIIAKNDIQYGIGIGILFGSIITEIINLESLK